LQTLRDAPRGWGWFLLQLRGEIHCSNGCIAAKQGMRNALQYNDDLLSLQMSFVEISQTKSFLEEGFKQ
jgi:hypothetical protein